MPATTIVPNVVQFLLCESATYDLAIDAWVLTRPLFDVSLPAGKPFPFVLDELAIYVQMTEGIGTHNLQIEVRVPTTQARIAPRTQPCLYRFPNNPGILVDDVFYLRDIPFRNPGEYEFRLLANGMELRSHSMAYLRVRG